MQARGSGNPEPDLLTMSRYYRKEEEDIKCWVINTFWDWNHSFSSSSAVVVEPVWEDRRKKVGLQKHESLTSDVNRHSHSGRPVQPIQSPFLLLGLMTCKSECLASSSLSSRTWIKRSFPFSILDQSLHLSMVVRVAKVNSNCVLHESGTFTALIGKPEEASSKRLNWSSASSSQLFLCWGLSSSIKLHWRIMSKLLILVARIAILRPNQLWPLPFSSKRWPPSGWMDTGKNLIKKRLEQGLGVDGFPALGWRRRASHSFPVLFNDFDPGSPINTLIVTN